MSFKHKHSILGGTFDYLHAGHKHFLEAALKVSEKLTIGLVASDALLKNKQFVYSVQDYDAREKSLREFISGSKRGDRVKIIPIDDFYGTALSDKSIDAIFVTEHGLENAKIINEKRQDIGLETLPINLVEFLYGNDKKIISSTRIRKGEINRMGFAYTTLFGHDLNLPDDLRKDVRVLGKVLPNILDLKKEIYNLKFVIAVGDVVMANLLSVDFTPNVGIIDFKTEREAFYHDIKLKIDLETNNNPGKISANAARAVNTAVEESLASDKPQAIRVNGEEDLLTLPAIMFSPLSSIVLYGLPPDQGVVAVSVTEDKKEQIRKVLEKFE